MLAKENMSRGLQAIRRLILHGDANEKEVAELYWSFVNQKLEEKRRRTLVKAVRHAGTRKK